MDFLLGYEAQTGRRARLAAYTSMNTKMAFVVHVEVKSNEFVELDADSEQHAHDLMDSWIDTMGNMSAAMRRVFPNGSVGKVIGRIRSWSLKDSTKSTSSSPILTVL
jgi:hypothetical protein